MWKKFVSFLLTKKMIALMTVAAVAVLSLVAVSLLPQQENLPDDVPGVEQSADDVGGGEQSDNPPVPDTPEDDKESFWDKIVNVITGKDNDPDKDNVSSGSGSSGARTFRVNFVTDGGTDLEEKLVVSGTKISSLKTPYKTNHIFEGWYYDEAATLPVASTDTVNEDMTLYASYIEMSPLEVIESKNFASAVDVAPSFTVAVVAADATMSEDDVLSGIEAKNLSDPDQKNFIKVTRSNGYFLIQSADAGFSEGSSFRIALTDGRLSFKDEPATVREYNFTTTKEEVLSLQYNEDIIYIPASDLSNIIINGQAVDSISIPLYEVSTDGNVDAKAMSKGTFTYTKGSLKVGDVVTVYVGVRPDLRTLDTPYEDCGEVAYVEITAKNGSTYSYQKAEAEDILFEPDMLPIPVAADTDADPNTVTVENKYLDYSADVYANIELDSQTTVDEGDFLVFYTGTFGVESGADAVTLTGVYGEVAAVRDNGDGTTTISYRSVDWETVQAAMDVYTSDRISGSDMIEDMDTAALESQIQQQAIDSGFAEEAAQYLASLALATENFTKLSENMNLEDYKVTLSDGTPISPEELQLMDSSVKAEFELDHVTPTIGIHPTHFEDASGTAASDQGLVVGLEVEGTLTLSKKGSDNTIEITISGTFLEEVGIDIGASHKAIWDTWGPFPYISEYRVTANVDLLNYTGIEVNATMVTKEADDDDDDDGDDGDDGDEGDSIADYIKGLLEKAAEEGEDEEDEEEEDNASKLVKHYSDMLEEEADFLKIVDAQLFEKKFYCSPQIPVICMEIQVDFIVELEACVSIGFDFEYLTGKRYVFTIDVFDLRATSDTITLLEEKYEFCFYAMGRLGVRAGIELTFKIGLFDTSTNSVGLQAGAGAYTKLWGYFYYELTYSTSQGKQQSYNGALLVEVGAFLELGLNAQVGDGLLAKDYEILDMEWPLWHAGNADNVLDFTTPQEEMPNIKLKQFVRSTVISDSTFLLHYLDLQEGEEMDAVYEDYFDPSKPASEKNRKNFSITFANDKFSYDPQTNTILVTPDEDDIKLEGEMTITWNHYPLAFSSKPIQRTISLYWDNLRDGYVIVPYTNGGTYIPLIVAEFEQSVSAPADPEKLGYTFAGWYSDEELTTKYTFPELMPAEDTEIYAKWEARNDIPYRVEHYQQQLLSGEYELFETDELAGTTNTYVTPAVKSYTGYTAPSTQELKVLPDGSAVLRYYYDLQWANVTFDPGMIGGEPVTYKLKYGARVIAPQMTEKGYTFAGWDSQVIPTMGLEDVTYTAQWTKNPDTEYRVEYYVQQSDGRYMLQHLIENEAFTGDTFTDEQLRALIVDVDNGLSADEKYIAENAFAFENMTVKGIACEEAAVDGSGKTVIKINYKRLSHTVTFDYGYDTKPVSNEICYEGIISVPKAERVGYDFMGWSVDGEIVTPAETMGLADLTYVAVWEAHNYTVKFYKNHAAADGTMEELAFTYDVAQALTKNTFQRPYYVFAGWGEQADGAVDYADGASVKNLTAENGAVVNLYAHWTPAVYDIVYHVGSGAVHANPVNYTVESETITLSAPVREGYIFRGWYTAEDFSGDAVTAINKGSNGNLDLYAKWEARTDISYKVEHYLETAEGGWALTETENLTGSVVAPITPAVKTYDHYTAPQVQSVTIALDGSTVVRYEYTRNSYTLTLMDGDVALAPITAKHGTPITLPTMQKEGYGFDGWFNGGVKFTANVMPTADMTLVANWVAGQYGYAINHYVQNVSGVGYTLQDSVTGTAAMDSVVGAAINSYTGFTAPTEAQSIVIGVDEAANVVDYYYERNQYTLTWDLGGGTAGGYTEGSVYYGAEIVAPVPVKTGYSYSWNAEIAAVMPDSDLSYTADWTANTYSVVFDLDGGSGAAETKTVTFDAPYGDLPALTKAGYAFDGWFTAKTGGEKVDAETIVSTASNHTLYARFSAVTYTITYHNADGLENNNPATYGVVTGNITLQPLTKMGYTFAGWYTAEDFSGTAVTTVAANRGEDLVLYAKWSENSYTVVFHSNTGSGESTTQEQFLYSENKALDANSFIREGYNFRGWATSNAATAAEYADQQVVSMLAEGGEVHLYAVWTMQEYAIRYENMDGAENAGDNPTSFTANSKIITLHEPTKTGYTFEGWYTDAGFTNQVSGTITLEASHDWIFYAKWSANQYVITFDSCLGNTVPNETLLMTYDQAANLTLLSEMTWFNNPGHTFLGWATTEGGEVVYKDGENVNNLVTSGRVDLYAVWQLNVYTVSYSNWDAGSDANPNASKTSFSVESESDIILADPVAKAGFRFLGWFDGETKVTTISKLDEKDYALKARWEHGGTFTIGFSGISNLKATYTVTRTIPSGAEASAAPQLVYVRTLNGTAYGTTPEAATATGQDKYHFVHVDPTKDGSGYVTFTPADGDGSTKTVTVQERDDYMANYATASYQINGATRNYYVELYKVLDTTGLCPGSLGENTRVTRTMPVSSYELTTDMYRWVSKVINSGTVTVDDAGYSKHKNYLQDPASIYNGSASSAEKAYRDIVSTKYGYRISFELKELDDGYQWLKLSTYDPSNGKTSVRGEYHFATKDGEEASSWGRVLYFPNIGTGKQGDVLFNVGDCSVSESYTTYNEGGYKYAVINAGNKVKIEFDAAGKSGSDEWQYRNLTMDVKVHDKNKPAAQYVAPLALTEYKAGEKLYLTVIYNEPINSISGTPSLDLTFTAASQPGMKFNSAISEYFKNPKYVNNGAYTNALVFEVTAARDLSADDVMKINEYLVFTESGQSGGFSSNIGTLSATVKDILGN